MTNREITDRYLKYKGMTRTKPESLGFQPILPFYVMDVVYEIYCKYVMPIPAARELKKAKNEWREAYNLLDRDFHRAFTQDEWADISDQMDAFREYIGNHLTVAVVSVMDVFKDFPLDEQQVLASLAIADVLATTAQVVWGNIYRNFTPKVIGGKVFEKDVPNVNQYIAAVTRAIRNYLDLYYLSIGGEWAQPEPSQRIVDARDALVRRIVRYLEYGKEADKQATA